MPQKIKLFKKFLLKNPEITTRSDPKTQNQYGKTTQNMRETKAGKMIR